MATRAMRNWTGITTGWLPGLLVLLALAGCGDKPTLSVSGQVTAGGTAFANVTMTLSGPALHTTTTDAAGSYSFGAVAEGNYLLTPSSSGYAFNPESRAVYIFGIDAAGFNFDGGQDGRIAAKGHTLYARRDGTLYAWGKNDDGQLGDGTTVSSATPLRISGVANVRSVAAGYDHSVALTADGKVYAWGNNTSGQLGDGTTTPSTTPAQVTAAGLTGVKAIAAGYRFTLVLNGDGTLWSWGLNGKGQLGQGTLTDSLSPKQLSLSAVASIAAGYDHALAARSDGTVWAWGSNGSGQLGNNTTTDSPSPVQVTDLATARYVAAGNRYSLALLGNGSVRAWGENTLGQLGDGTLSNRSTAVTPVGLVSGSTTAIAAGHDHAAARRTDGTLLAWGNNTNGQLGDGTTTVRTLPQPVAGLTGLVAVTAGQGDSIALVRTGEALWSWGANGSGQLGDGSTTERWSPVPVLPLP